MHAKQRAFSINGAARFAGSLYLLIFIAGPFGFFFVRSRVIVPGDAMATVSGLAVYGPLFRLGMVSDAVIFLSEIALAAILYAMFRPVNRTVSLAMTFSRLAEAVLQGVNLLNYFLVLSLVGGAAYLSAFEPRQSGALAMLFLEAYENVALIWGIFFGFHLLLLGYLVFRSGFLPRILGVLAALASLGYLADGIGNILLPQYKDFFATAVVVLALPGELLFTLWLLIKGVDAGRWETLARESAE
jgi:hypothetical protein